MSTEEMVIKSRGFENFENDEQMLAWCEKQGVFYSSGLRRTILDFYISDYCLDRIYDYLTKAEVMRLRELQESKRAEYKAAEAARGWVLVGRYGYADNSTEEVWRDKDGIEKTIMVTPPHGDACF